MSTTSEWTTFPQPQLPRDWSLADLREHLGGVPISRIRLFPSPGTATEEDLLNIEDHEDRICELVDGTLVEKTTATIESMLAMTLGHLLLAYLDKNPCGVVTGESGTLRILPTKIRAPDVAFISWDRFPGRKLPDDRIYRIAPDLAVEIISQSNTKAEMDLKLQEYFEAGVLLVWYIDPQSRTAQVFTAVDQETAIDESGTLSGQDVLPGFELRLGELFERVERQRGA